MRSVHQPVNPELRFGPWVALHVLTLLPRQHFADVRFAQVARAEAASVPRVLGRRLRRVWQARVAQGHLPMRARIQRQNKNSQGVGMKGEDT
jgi:hypothetical protein